MRFDRHPTLASTACALVFLLAAPLAPPAAGGSSDSLWESAVAVVRGASGGSETHVQWTGEGGERIEMRARGEVEFAADDSDVVGLGRNGFFMLETGRRGDLRRIEIRVGRGGELTRSYFVAGRRQEYDESARRWLAERLPEVIRESGLGAPARVERILAAGGVSAVLDEVERISGGWAQKRYLELLFERAELDVDEQVRVLARIERAIRSDYEKAELLRRESWLSLGDRRVMTAFLAAAGTIDSDYESRRALGALLASGRLPAPAVEEILVLAAGIGSDYEKATLLVELTGHALRGETAVASYLELAATIGSGYERRRALSALLSTRDLSAANLEPTILAAAGIDSDYEKATLLVELAREQPLAGGSAAAYVEVAGSIGSDYERKRALVALLDGARLAEADVARVLDVASGIGSAYEKATLLALVAGRAPLAGAAADAYLRAAASLGNAHETWRALDPFLASAELGTPAVRAALELVARLDSYQRGELLEWLAPRVAGDVELEALYGRAADGLSSDADYRKAMRALERERRGGGGSS